MTFWRFYCIDRNFLIIRWGILNFFYFRFQFWNFKKCKFRRFAHFEVLVIDKYRYVAGKSFLAVTVLVNDKYCQMTEAAKLYF
jgi:hypothetical protein